MISQAKIIKSRKPTLAIMFNVGQCYAVCGDLVTNIIANAGFEVLLTYKQAQHLACAFMLILVKE